MYSYKAYPTDEDFAEVATALINKHPCLREQGSSTGCGGWKNSLKFKMGKYRSKLRKAGCLDVSVNGGRRGKYSPEGQPPKQNFKNHEEMKEITFLISLWERIKYLLKKIGNCLLKKCEKDCQTRP